jgi:hypothetical protein
VTLDSALAQHKHGRRGAGGAEEQEGKGELRRQCVPSPLLKSPELVTTDSELHLVFILLLST